MTTDGHDLPEAPGFHDTLEYSRSSTQQSVKCQSCGAMFEAGEHMEPGAMVCPVCRRRETDHPGRLQSSDQGF